MFTEEQAIAELAHRVFLHGKRANRVNVHDSKGQSCKNTRVATRGENKKPATGTFFRKSLMAGNPLLLVIFGQKKGRWYRINISVLRWWR